MAETNIVTLKHPVTGELVDWEVETEGSPVMRTPTEDSAFALVYFDELSKKHLSGRAWQVLMLLCRDFNMNTGEVRYTATDIGLELGIGVNYVSRVVTELQEKGVLVRYRRGVIALNPLLIHRGSPALRRRIREQYFRLQPYRMKAPE